MRFSILVLLFLSGCFFSQAHHHPHLPKTIDLNGREQPLAAYMGNHTLLFLGASWCPECVLELSMLNRLVQKLEGKDVRVVMVAIDDSVESIKSLPSTRGARYPILIDAQDQVKREYPVSGLPTAYLLDARGDTLPLIDPEDGEAKDSVVGYREWQSEAGVRAILQSLPNALAAHSQLHR